MLNKYAEIAHRRSLLEAEQLGEHFVPWRECDGRTRRVYRTGINAAIKACVNDVLKTQPRRLYQRLQVLLRELELESTCESESSTGSTCN